MIKNARITCDSNPHLITTRLLLGPPPRRRHEISLLVPEEDAIGKCCDNFVTVQLHINDDAIAGAYQFVVEIRVWIEISFTKSKFRWRANFFYNWGFHNLALHRSEESAHPEELRESALAMAATPTDVSRFSVYILGCRWTDSSINVTMSPCVTHGWVYKYCHPNLQNCDKYLQS